MNELDFARNEIAKLHDDIHKLTEERDELRATIERMEQQVPIAYYWMNLEKSKHEIGPSPSDRWLSWPLYEFPGAQEQPVLGAPDGWLDHAAKMAELSKKLREPGWCLESIRDMQRELHSLEDAAIAKAQEARRD